MFSDVNTIGQIIQLAVAPVFLLAGIAGFLSVMSGRLGRIIDRERVISRRLATLKNSDMLAASQREHRILTVRVKTTNRAIGLCTGSALVVCALITSLFIDSLFDLEISRLVITLFILALVLLMLALLLFLREIQLATRSLKLATVIVDE